jgi:hypothetical protein
VNQETIEVSKEEYAAIAALHRFVAYNKFKGALFGLMVGYLIGAYTS